MTAVNQLKVGDTIRDNDPRQEGRTVRITECAAHDFVYGISKKGVKVRISRKRIHTDGKPRRSGFNLVTGGAQ